jgi:hypothetical protein
MDINKADVKTYFDANKNTYIAVLNKCFNKNWKSEGYTKKEAVANLLHTIKTFYQ